MTDMVPPLRDEQGRRVPDAVELDAIRHAAQRDGYTRPGFRGETVQDWICRAAGAESRAWASAEAVEADLRERREAGDSADSGVRTQLETLHRHLNFVDLTDRGDLHAFQERMKMEAAASAMGPGSGIARLGPDGQMIGDPEVVARSRAAEAAKARMAAQAQASRDAEAVKFAGPYNLYGSVG